MATTTDLLSCPDEILSQIISCLSLTTSKYVRPTPKKSRKTDILAVALLCHRISALARPIIFHCVSLSFEPTTEDYHSGDFFIRSLEGNLTLRHMVRSLKLTLYGQRNEIDIRVGCLLNLVPCLKSLDLDYLPIGWDDSKPSTKLHSSIQSQSLSEVSLRGDGITADDVADYISLKGIKSLTVAASIEYDVGDWELNKHVFFVEKSSSLIKLDIKSAFNLSTKSLQILLTWPKSLHTLECLIPEHIHQRSRRVPNTRLGPSTLFCPAKLSLALSVVKTSLVVLRLHKGYGKSLGHSKTSLDLSMMEKLRTISVHSDCFFEPGTASASSSGITRFLPPSVERLEIEFEHTDDLRLSLEIPAVDSDLLDPSNMDTTLWTWVWKLAQNKPTFTPQLTQFSLYERSSADIRRPFLQRHPWTLRPSLIETFKDCNIFIETYSVM